MTEGERAERVLEGLVEWARAACCLPDGTGEWGGSVDAGGLAGRVERHARRVLAAGGSPVEALDSALVLLLHAGEGAADRTDPGDDPLGVRPVARRMRAFPERIAGDAPVRPGPLRNRSGNLQLMTTRVCQLRCSYCPVVKGGSQMPAEVMSAAADLLLTTDRDRVRLDFSGGEPLLRYDEVARTAERLLEGTARSGKRASFYMVTNGFLLDARRARTLADLGFRVELSLDGPRHVHNRCKLPVDRSEDPYRRTVAALEASLAAGLPHTVVMVVTPETVDGMRESFEHAIDRGARSVDVNYAVGRYWDVAPLEAYLSGLVSIIEDYRDELSARRIELGNVGSRVEPAVLNAEWMVDTDGTVHPMTEWALESSRPAGAADLGRGHVGSLGGWDDLYAGRFHAYESLLRTYSWRDGSLRRVLYNNVCAGRTVSRRLAESR
jgi:MoaA/NifB/PqqE/SkfB family radical SAM enzyme